MCKENGLWRAESRGGGGGEDGDPGTTEMPPLLACSIMAVDCDPVRMTFSAAHHLTPRINGDQPNRSTSTHYVSIPSSSQFPELDGMLDSW